MISQEIPDEWIIDVKGREPFSVIANSDFFTVTSEILEKLNLSEEEFESTIIQVSPKFTRDRFGS